MRFRQPLAIVLLTSSVMLMLPAEACAQSLLDNFFGIFSGKPATPSPASATTRINPPPIGYGRSDFGTWYDGDYEDWDRSGSYRTVCVRLCDGYYWPLSHAAKRRDLSRDASVCTASCSGEAHLFYQASSSSDPDLLVDQAGRRYRDLPNAFRYRKTLVSGCACKPAPWSAAETARHRSYAAAAAVTVVAGGLDQRETIPAAEVVAGAVDETDALTGEAAAFGEARQPLAFNDLAPTEAQDGGQLAPADAAPVDWSPDHAPSTTQELVRNRPIVRPLRRTPPARSSANQASNGGFSFFPLGQPTFLWPGDTPRRYR